MSHSHRTGVWPVAAAVDDEGHGDEWGDAEAQEDQHELVHLRLLQAWRRIKVAHALYTVKKGSRVSRPQPGCHYQTRPGREKWRHNWIIPAQGEFGSDIQAGDGKLVNLFYGVAS